MEEEIIIFDTDILNGISTTIRNALKPADLVYGKDFTVSTVETGSNSWFQLNAKNADKIKKIKSYINSAFIGCKPEYKGSSPGFLRMNFIVAYKQRLVEKALQQ